MIRLAIGWTLVHSLWQGAALAVLLALALSLARSPRARYGAACCAMLGLALCFTFTLGRSIQAGNRAATPLERRLTTATLDGADGLRSVPGRFEAAEVLPWLTPFWMAGVLAFYLRSLANWRAARRLVRQGVCAAPVIWLSRVDELRARLRLSTPVVLLESSLAEVPAVAGWLRPVILVPVGMLAGMPAVQMEAILLHELAHIRRHDYLINLLQNAMEGLLFYHPAVWWFSSVMRTEREHCCDDVAAALSGDVPGYAAALVAFEQNRWSARDAALAANGGPLMKRVRRLLYPLEAPASALPPVLPAAILLFSAALVLTAWQTNNSKPADDSPYAKWVKEDVAYIINDQERAAFKALTTDEEREKFIEQFWLRRDPTPGTVQNEAKEEHYRRIAYANDRFMASVGASVPGWKTDRGRVYIVHGPADEIESHPKGGKAHSFPYEQWLYHHIDGVGENVIIDFIDPESKGEYRMSSDPH